MINIHFITLFPEMIASGLSQGIPLQAAKKNLFQFQSFNPRDFTQNVHHTIDDKPFGGGDGMLMMYEPLKSALDSIPEKGFVVYLSPQGKTLNQKIVDDLKQKSHITFVCGRYAGIDQRFINQHVDMELSIGDYVMSGGELAALVVTDCLVRQLEGALGHSDSSSEDSFSIGVGLLEGPQYTRPREIAGESVPEILLSGHHKNLQEWKKNMAVIVTLQKRPDLFKEKVSAIDAAKALSVFKTLTEGEKRVLGLKDLSEKDFEIAKK